MKIPNIKNVFTDYIVEHCPEKIVKKKANSVIKFIGDNISSPEQRLILGLTGVASQPFIDMKNKNISDDTRSVSVARTLAKNIAGATVGVTVRALVIAATKNFAKMKPAELTNGVKHFVKENKSFLAPKEVSDYSDLAHSNYINALGTIIATVVMLGTNFIFDAPLTLHLTNFFTKTFKKAGDKNEKTC